MLLKSFDKYDEVKKEFNMYTHTTTTTTSTIPGHSASIDVNFSGLSLGPGTSTGQVPAPVPAQPTNSSGLEARVTQLEEQNSLLEAELAAVKAQQAVQAKKLDSVLKILQSLGAPTR